MWTLMSDGEATEAIGVVADIRRESKFFWAAAEVVSFTCQVADVKEVKLYK